MNCQQISRIADSGSFSKLGAVELGEAEAHASSCARCAAVWGAHAGLATLPIPEMPAELTLRCRTLAALPANNTRRPMMRRLTVVGSLVALAAAAGLLVMQQGGKPVQESQPAVAAAPDAVAAPMPTVATPAATPEVPNPVAREAATAAPPKEVKKPEPQEPLPLLLPPVYAGAAERNALMDQALRKVVERHPELVDGPAIEGQFFVGALMQDDGALLDSVVKQAAGEAMGDTSAEIQRALPNDGAGRQNSGRRKGSLLPDGRALRADVSLIVATVSTRYDMARSSMRVLEALGHKYDDLLLPATGEQMNRLTVLMWADGRIQREHVDSINRNLGSGRSLRGGDTSDADFLARSIADRLEIDPSQIGLMGVTAVEQGSLVLSAGPDGVARPDDRRRMLQVYYAWPRRAGDPGPTLGQAGSTAVTTTTYDQVAALKIVERLMPDAFTSTDRTAGTPTIVLSAKGEVIRVGRVKYTNGGAMDTILQEQLVPGVMTNSFMSARLRNNLGETAEVTLAWAASPEMVKAFEETRRKAAEAAAQQ
jgi:hypothetical protein